jgi:CBS domain-containing protein
MNLAMVVPAIKPVFSERDYARKVILHGKASKDTLVKEIMSTEMFWVRPDQTVAVCMELMTNKRCTSQYNPYSH